MPQIELLGQGLRPAGTVYAIGRNYAEHAKEMDAEPVPVVFIKPASAVLPGGGDVPWPCESENVHYEGELVLLLGAGGRNLDPAAAEAAIAGVAIGVDLTARDIQAAAKAKGEPWARSKGFYASAPVSPFVPRASLPAGWADLDLSLSVDGQLRQSDRSASMIFDPPTIVGHLSRWFALEPGDLVFTGTPKGVGGLAPGQRVVATSVALAQAVSFRMVR